METQTQTRRRRQQSTTPSVMLTGPNLWGRMEQSTTRDLVPTRQLQRHRQNELDLMHRPKNGVYDPITYYHLLDLVMQLAPGTEFRTSDLLIVLRIHKPQLVWDATSVGRILADIADNLQEAYGTPVLFQTKRWNGMSYYTDGHPERRAAMIRLVKDLEKLAKDVVTAELMGEAPKRIDSPLRTCPSLV